MDHEASWKPTNDFSDQNGTFTDVWLEYIKKHNILPEC